MFIISIIFISFCAADTVDSVAASETYSLSSLILFAEDSVSRSENDISDVLSYLRLELDGEDGNKVDEAANTPEDIPAANTPEVIAARNRRSKALNDRQSQPASNPSSPVGRGEHDIGSLELSETQSQSVDGTEAVTQPEDVADQLEAEKLRVAEKIAAARNRRSKALHHISSQCTDIVVHDSAGVSDGPLSPVNPVPVKKIRTTCRKVKSPPDAPVRRSPRVLPRQSPDVDGKRQSPKVIQRGSSANLNPAAAKKEKAANQAVSKAKAPVDKKKNDVLKRKEKVLSKGQQTRGSTKKLPRATRKSMRFAKDDDFESDDGDDGDEEGDDDEPYVSEEVSDSGDDIGKVNFYFIISCQVFLA